MHHNIAAGRVLRETRIAQARGVVALARALGVSHPAVHGWETGKRRIPDARILQIPVALGLDEQAAAALVRDLLAARTWGSR